MKSTMTTTLLVMSCVLGCHGASARQIQPAPPPNTAGLELQFEEQRCFSAGAVGDTVRASVLRRGDLLSPPADSGSTVLLVVRESEVGSLADPSSRPHVRLDPILLRVGGVLHPLRIPSPAFEPRVSNAPLSSVLQMCVVRGGRLVFLS